MEIILTEVVLILDMFSVYDTCFIFINFILLWFIHFTSFRNVSMRYGVDGKITLEWILGKLGGKVWTGCMA